MLTEVACKAASCPPDKARARYTDAGGLYLEVSPTGSKRWFWKYTLAGKEKRLALGSYPEVKLKAAREARDEARKLQRAGTDPVVRRRVDKAAALANHSNTYELLARAFHCKQAPSWSEVHAAKWLRLQEMYLFPWIGQIPVRDISAPILLEPLQRVENKGLHETAVSLRQYAGQVFRFGIATGRCTHDPATQLRDALRTPQVRHMAAVLTPEKVGQLMRAIDAYDGMESTKEALLLSALLFQRPGNIRAMEWAWVDFDNAMLTIPASAMKRTKEGKRSGQPHDVPLARQALAALKRVHGRTGHGVYVFPSILTGERPMSDNTINVALRRMGYTKEEMTAHGFRAMARTLLAERLDVNPEYIEEQLAHGKSGPLGSAYDRAKYREQRREMMQQWADYLEKLRDCTQVF